MSLSATELARYSRHLPLTEIGLAGQEKLRAARVLVVGAGGLGSPAALYLAAAGIGTLGLADHDRVDVSNLQRQILFGTNDIERLKSEAGADRLRALNPDVKIVAHSIEVSGANAIDLIDKYDIVVDGSDRLATRYIVNDACVLRGKPLVSAAVHRFEGQAMTYVPGKGPCYRCLFADAARDVVPNCAEAGVLGVLPGVLGAIQATEVIKLITGAGAPLIGRLLIYDALQMRFDEFSFQRRRDCAVCGDHPTITGFNETAMPATANLRRLPPQEVQPLLKQSGFSIVDVREPYEFEAGHLPGSIHIPLGELRDRFSEIPSDKTPIFICRVGGRSIAACEFALRSGMKEAVNLEGGLRAWASQVDPTLVVA